jgi:hypothetical protein
MKKIVLILFILLPGLYVYAQQAAAVDSMTKALSNAKTLEEKRPCLYDRIGSLAGPFAPLVRT